MTLDWSKCAAVESVPGKVSGAWVFRGTRIPVAAAFENLEDGLTINEVTALYDGLTREQVKAVLEFTAQSLGTPLPLSLMRILFDQGTPVAIRNALEDHSVRTTSERGWSMLALSTFSLAPPRKRCHSDD